MTYIMYIRNTCILYMDKLYLDVVVMINGLDSVSIVVFCLVLSPSVDG